MQQERRARVAGGAHTTTRRSPLLSTWQAELSLQLSTVTTSPGVTLCRGDQNVRPGELAAAP